MKRIHLLIPALLVMALASGCTVRGGLHARATAPSMVLISPGVYVVEDHSEPVFYSEGAYWRYHSGVWYSSSVHHGGWVRVRTVPGHVRRIDRPHTYVRYRGSVRGNARGNVRNDRPAVRDNRDNRGGARVRQPVRNDRPGVRDHRVNPRDQRDNRNDAGSVRVKTQVKVKSSDDGKSKSKSKSKVKVRDHR